MDNSADVLKAGRIDYTQLRQRKTPDKTFLTWLWTHDISLMTGSYTKSSKCKTTMHFTYWLHNSPRNTAAMGQAHLYSPLQHTTKRPQTEVLGINQYTLRVNNCEGQQISAFRREMRTAFFWVKTQRAAVISCRRFCTTYRFRNVVKELLLAA